MMLIERIARDLPIVIDNALTPELIIAPAPELISAAPATTGLLTIAVFAVVGIMAVVTLWQTMKLYRPSQLARIQ